MPELAYIALGSNLGDRRAYLEGGLGDLGDLPGIEVCAVSSLYETPPEGYEAQPSFLNAAAALRSALPPEELLAAMQRIEERHQRQRTLRWGPRTLDLDLLLYGQRQVCRSDLVLPHPRISERCFVLAPLCEIAPELRHPLTGRLFRLLYRELGCTGRVQPAGALRVLSLH